MRICNSVAQLHTGSYSYKPTVSMSTGDCNFVTCNLGILKV